MDFHPGGDLLTVMERNEGGMSELDARSVCGCEIFLVSIYTGLEITPVCMSGATKKLFKCLAHEAISSPDTCTCIYIYIAYVVAVTLYMTYTCIYTLCIYTCALFV